MDCVLFFSLWYKRLNISGNITKKAGNRGKKNYLLPIFYDDFMSMNTKNH